MVGEEASIRHSKHKYSVREFEGDSKAYPVGAHRHKTRYGPDVGPADQCQSNKKKDLPPVATESCLALWPPTMGSTRTVLMVPWIDSARIIMSQTARDLNTFIISTLLRDYLQKIMQDGPNRQENALAVYGEGVDRRGVEEREKPLGTKRSRKGRSRTRRLYQPVEEV